MTQLHLRLPELAELREVLACRLGTQREVWVVGSRATGRRLGLHSDIDLPEVGAPLGVALRADLQEAFSESDLPMAVDLIEGSVDDPGFVQWLRSRGAACIWSTGQSMGGFELEHEAMNER